MEDSKVSHPEGELLIGPGPLVEDEAVSWTVHRLQTKGLLFYVEPKIKYNRKLLVNNSVIITVFNN